MGLSVRMQITVPLSEDRTGENWWTRWEIECWVTILQQQEGSQGKCGGGVVGRQETQSGGDGCSEWMGVMSMRPRWCNKYVWVNCRAMWTMISEGGTCYVLEAPNSFFTCLLILSHHVTCSHPLSITWPYHLTAYLSFLTMWFSLAMHVTHTDSNLVACILGLTRESVWLRMTPYFVRWLLTSTGTSSIRLESWQLPRCI